MREFTEFFPRTPCWVDVMSPELDRTVSFYSDLFGWVAEQDPRPEAGGYTMLSKDGKPVAAAMPPQQEGMPSFWSTYIASDDDDATAVKIREAGGTLIVEPSMSSLGRMLVAKDPTGVVCRTNDAEAAETFCRAVLGYEIDTMPMGEGEPYRVLELGDKRVGGLFQINAEMGDVQPNWATAFAVADTDATCARPRSSVAKCSCRPWISRSSPTAPCSTRRARGWLPPDRSASERGRAPRPHTRCGPIRSTR
ncbi:MAG: VOC family protein [Gaiellaceae bacterium MAG52_C11]|nr:VOC family protein [Candidatus Gaiellasilicea maunaloa]